MSFSPIYIRLSLEVTCTYVYVNHTSVPANIAMQSTYSNTAVLYIELYINYYSCIQYRYVN